MRPGVKLKRLTGYLGVRVGEARHPGPLRPHRKCPRILCFNSGGAPGAWRLLNSVPTADIIAIQECNMSEAEWKAFAYCAVRQNYKAYYLAGPRSPDQWGNQRTLGGVAFMTRKSVYHTFAGQESFWGVQSIGLWVAGTLIINCYSPPGHDAVTPELFNAWWAQLSLDHKSWLVVGDFNGDPDNTEAGKFLSLHGGSLLGDPSKGSRWKSERFIDWGMKSRHCQAHYDGQHDSIQISDHIGFWVQMTNPVQSTRKGRLKLSPSWKIPSWLSREDWIQALENIWNTEIIGSSSFGLLQSLCNSSPNSVNQQLVQQEWDLFNRCLAQCFHKTLVSLRAAGLADPALTTELETMIKQNGLAVKGQTAQFQWINDSQPSRGDPNPGEKLRKLRKQVARCYELRRWCLKGRWPPDTLLRAVWPHTALPEQLSCLLSKVDDHLHNLHDLLNTQESQMKQQRLRAWKHRLNDPTLKGLAAWI